ncbi:hypothetical protein R8510_04035 [Ralstonia chuxiongensis]|nr:hypothetical protein R8510_04035 [Ralstonia chuxiongensis]
MKVPKRRTHTDRTNVESPEAIRARLARFATATRDMALERSKAEEPPVQGAVLAGRRIRAKS